MSAHSLDGYWRGQYTYGEAYGPELMGVSVNFEMDIKFDGDVFTGTFTDDETRHLFTKPGTVEGTFYDNYISMIKRYPCLTAFDENNNAVAVPDEPSLDIHYTGTLRKRGLGFWDFFEGEWTITASLVTEDGKTVFYTAGGEWTMKR